MSLSAGTCLGPVTTNFPREGTSTGRDLEPSVSHVTDGLTGGEQMAAGLQVMETGQAVFTCRRHRGRRELWSRLCPLPSLTRLADSCFMWVSQSPSFCMRRTLDQKKRKPFTKETQTYLVIHPPLPLLSSIGPAPRVLNPGTPSPPGARSVLSHSTPPRTPGPRCIPLCPQGATG